MPRSRSAVSYHLSGALLLSGLLACAQAAELGEPVLRSHIGQPLVADIELTALADEAAPVQVRLANADVYRGANIGMHPVLASLNMTVMRRDGRQYLHITSLKPVDAEHVHIFLELADGGRRNLRGATLWLTPDPNPAPPVLAATAATAAAAGPAAAAAPPVTPSPPSAPARPATKPPGVPAPLAAAPGTAPARAARSRTMSAAPARAGAALDYKNAALTAQIVELEEKVKLLQLAVEDKPAAAAPVRPVPRPALPLVAGAPSKPVAPPARKTPWLLIGLAAAGVLALAGGAFVLIRKKRKGGSAPAADTAALPPKPSFIASVKNRLMPSKQAAGPAEVHVEPSAGQA